MGKITFKKIGSQFESSEITVNGNFNLHLERDGRGSFNILQRTAGKEFADVAGARTFFNDSVIDVDVEMLIAPKTVKIVSKSEVTEAYITEEA